MTNDEKLEAAREAAARAMAHANEAETDAGKARDHAAASVIAGDAAGLAAAEAVRPDRRGVGWRQRRTRPRA